MANNKRNRPKQIIAFAIIPFVLAVPPIVGWALGTYLDGLCGTEPWLMYLFVILGLIAGVRELFRLIKEFGE